MDALISSLWSTWTVVVCVIFGAIVAWAMSSRRKAEFEAAARIPLEDDEHA